MSQQAAANQQTVSSQQLKTRPRYTLNPGDTLTLEYRLTPDLNQMVVIRPDGFINVAIAGDLRVAGLTMEDAKKAILAAVSNELNDPQLNLTLKDFVRSTVLVSGEVQHPGPIEIRDNVSAISAILMAGGYTENAKSGEVILFRRLNGSIVEVHKLGLTRLANAKAREQDCELQPGDMIYVTRDKASRLTHYMKVANMGMYFNPFQP